MAAGLPWLWTVIRIDPRTERQADIIPALFDTWIQQTKLLPLSLSLVGKYITSPILDLVHSRAVTLQRLSCWEIPIPLYTSLFNRPSAFVASLVTLELEIWVAFLDELPHDDSELLRCLDTPFENAPFLRQVRFHGALFDLTTLRMPWSQLTDLHLQFVRIPLDMTLFIHELVLLEKLTLEVKYRGSFDGDTCLEPAFPMTTLPNLHHLGLICWNSDAMILPEFFDYVTLPVLKEFRLEFIAVDYLPHAAFISMHERSGFDLEQLTISRVDIESVAIAREIYGRMSSLLSFETNEDPNCYSNIRRALIYDTRWPVLPLLQKIRFFGDPPKNNFEETFTEVIESRWWPDDTEDDSRGPRPSQRLTSAHLWLEGRKTDEATKMRLLEFQKEGLELTIVETNTTVPMEELYGFAAFGGAESDSDEEAGEEGSSFSKLRFGSDAR